MSPIRLKRRRVVIDSAGAERVLIDDAPLPKGWREHGQRSSGEGAGDKPSSKPRGRQAKGGDGDE